MMRRIAFQCSPYGARTMLGVKFILREEEGKNKMIVTPGATHVQLSDHGENGAVRIRRLAHETGSNVTVADDDDVQAEDLDVHNVTWCTCKSWEREMSESSDRDDMILGDMMRGTRRWKLNTLITGMPRRAPHHTTPYTYMRACPRLVGASNHVPNTLLHSANGIQADSKGQSKRLSMSGQPRGPGGSGNADALRRRRRIRNAMESNATRT